jgi:uncharacterized membrane protein
MDNLTHLQDKEVNDLFRISVMLKGLVSALEVVGGLLFLLIPPEKITAFAIFLTQDELSDDPNAFLASRILHAAENYSSHTALIIGFFLLSRGIIKLVLVTALLKNKLWAYPASLAVLGLFVLYELFDVITRHSVIVLGICVFDLIVIFFIWREWNIVRAGGHKNRLASLNRP